MKYLERLRAQATITWRNDELKKAYEQRSRRCELAAAARRWPTLGGRSDA